MKAFYNDILRRREAGSTLSPLERVVLLEGASGADLQQIHQQELQNVLKQIAQREKEARAYGAGQQDWVLAALNAALADALEYGRSMDRAAMNALSPQEISLRLRAQKNRPAAEIYPLLRQGLTAPEIAAKLEIPLEAVHRAERRLVRLYRRIVSRSEETPSEDPGGEVFHQLMQGPYRIFRRWDTGVVHYRFYHRDRLLGTGSAQVLPDFPLVLRCNGLHFCSSIDPKTTIFPGVYRKITDADDPGLTAARLTWLDSCRHELRLNWDTGPVTIQIHSREDIHRFYMEDRLIGEILPLPRKQQMLDWELFSCMRLYEALPDETAVLLMSYPLLRLAP